MRFPRDLSPLGWTILVLVVGTVLGGLLSSSTSSSTSARSNQPRPGGMGKAGMFNARGVPFSTRPASAAPAQPAGYSQPAAITLPLRCPLVRGLFWPLAVRQPTRGNTREVAESARFSGVGPYRLQNTPQPRQGHWVAHRGARFGDGCHGSLPLTASAAARRVASVTAA
jgi:hypothetical protein